MGAWRSSGDASLMWTMMAQCIKEAAREVLGVSKELEGKGWDKMMYRLAKLRDRKACDLDQVKFIKDEEGSVLLDEAHIYRRWQTYFHSLLNEEGDRDTVLVDLGSTKSRCDFGYCRQIRVEEVMEAMHKMSWSRAIGPDKIPMEF
ncbi:uncharacterized protein LOC142169029 [Nicotiana tabacum]|uniref:Uncharacterized protein LOC142169029 n=1 Tax=Nicotiana tabacum TaxID=4097 RepID=A0AC58SMX5_TOBAC